MNADTDRRDVEYRDGAGYRIKPRPVRRNTLGKILRVWAIASGVAANLFFILWLLSKL